MSEQETVSIGSVGILKSGGPQMTVVIPSLDRNPDVARFTWMNDDGKLDSADLPKACIKFESHPKPAPEKLQEIASSLGVNF